MSHRQSLGQYSCMHRYAQGWSAPRKHDKSTQQRLSPQNMSTYSSADLASAFVNARLVGTNTWLRDLIITCATRERWREIHCFGRTCLPEHGSAPATNAAAVAAASAWP